MTATGRTSYSYYTLAGTSIRFLVRICPRQGVLRLSRSAKGAQADMASSSMGSKIAAKLQTIKSTIKSSVDRLGPDREFETLIRAIGECKSKQEEDRIMVAEIETLKQVGPWETNAMRRHAGGGKCRAGGAMHRSGGRRYPTVFRLACAWPQPTIGE